MKRKSFESEDTGAVDRATKNKSNHPDRKRQAVSRPSAGTLTAPPEKIASGASAMSRPGEPMAPSARNAGKKLNPDQDRALKLIAKRENGGAAGDGGWR